MHNTLFIARQVCQAVIFKDSLRQLLFFDLHVLLKPIPHLNRLLRGVNYFGDLSHHEQRQVLVDIIMAARDHVARELTVLHGVRHALLGELIELLKLDLVSFRELLSFHLDHGFFEHLALLRREILEIFKTTVVCY